MSHQRYTNPRSLEWMAQGLCPECGHEVESHGGLGGPGCTLTDNGVAGRIHQFKIDYHELSQIVEFTQKRVGWDLTPGGGRVPVYEKVRSYFRWYCCCGSVGGKADDYEAAFNGHVNHVNDLLPEGTYKPLTKLQRAEVEKGYTIIGDPEDREGTYLP